MWMSADKRRLLAKETSGLPYLSGVSREIAHRATQIRDEILETVFDQFIKPDDAKVDVSTTSRWKRARQLWKTLLTESRASYFVDLQTSRFLDWIRTGAATVLPCTTDEVKTRDQTLPELQGPPDTVGRAREIRAAFLKYADELERGLLERKAGGEERQRLERARDVLRGVTDAEWLVKRQPKDYGQSEKLMDALLKEQET
jgi:hypothetical protein